MKAHFILLILFVSCNQRDIDNREKLKQQITDADISMSELAAKEGFNSALLAFADTDFVKLGEGKLPIIGKAAFEKSFAKGNDVKTISWTPVEADVAKSGELGYTWGNWKYTIPDTVYYGNYFTIWKKQPDGSWKMALDGGNNTPEPK
jgi:ketosteroid isomerase-like protein